MVWRDLARLQHIPVQLAQFKNRPKRMILIARRSLILHSSVPPSRSILKPQHMKRVTSLGGIFFKCKDVQKLKAWYGEHLGLDVTDYGTNFEWRQIDDPEKKGMTIWSPFKESTTYFNLQRRILCSITGWKILNRWWKN